MKVYSNQELDIAFSQCIARWLQTAFLPTLEALKGDKVALNILLTEERRRNCYLESRLKKLSAYKGNIRKLKSISNVKKLMNKEII
jgi:hypothetical protein